MSHHTDSDRAHGGGPFDMSAKIPADVRYYTKRPFSAALAAQILPILVMLPFIIMAPETAGIVLLTAGAMGFWTQASFKFELTDREMRVRDRPFTSVLTVPLRDIAAVEALDVMGKPLTWGRNAPMGHLRVKLADGEDLLITGLADPAEAAEAVRTLQKQAA
jgi:hypothetical protein